MIRIHKGKVPVALSDQGVSKKKAMDAHRTAIASGETNIEFKSLYSSASVKKQLIAEQQGKCCFCEAAVRNVAHGDVEHFRPKGGWHDRHEDALHQPGYWWLAYTWENLLFSCQLCNQKSTDLYTNEIRGKGNRFPLLNPAFRIGKKLDENYDTSQEQPFLIHPAMEDPSSSLTYHQEEIVAKNERGQKTI